MRGGVVLRSGKKTGSNKRKVRSNKGQKRIPYGKRVKRHPSGRKVRSNKGQKRTKYGPRSRTRSGRKFR